MAVVTVAFSDLYDWLDNQPDNTADTPYELNITGLTISDIRSSSEEASLGQTIKKHPSKYVDLSATSIPDGVTNMQGTFHNCSSLVNAPVIPDGVTNMNSTFSSCTSLVSVPIIPNSVIYMVETFDSCTALVSVPKLPDGVTELAQTFQMCSSLKNAPIIPDGVTRMGYTFNWCTSLTHKPLIPSSVIDSTRCYGNVTTSNWKGTQSQAESFLNTFFTQTTDSELQVYNDDRVTLEDTICNVDISTLSTYLAGLDPNAVSTAYKVYIRGLTSSNASDIKAALLANGTKYVDLGYTQIPDGTDCTDLFGLPNHGDTGCDTLVIAPKLPTDATDLMATFGNCHNLKEAPVIPNTVTYMSFTFSECTSLREPAILPNNLQGCISTYQGSGVTKTGNLNISTLTQCYFMFFGCVNLTEVNNLPPNLEIMFGMFSECTSLKSLGSISIPSTVTNMRSVFSRSGLETAPVIPEGVTDIRVAFENCSDLQTVPYIPSTVTYGSNCFSGCTSLRKIEEFKIPLNTLKNNSDFKDMFKNCNSLEQIGHKSEYSDDWHLVYLDFDTNTVQGKIYSRDKSSISITQTNITKNTLSLPLITDELMFSSPISTAALENIIEGTAQQRGMLDTNYSWYGKSVIPPTGDNFIMYAKDPNKFSSNIKFGGGIDVEVVSASKSIMPTQDKREIINTASITLTLDYGATNGVIVEAYAMEDCSITFYKGASITETLSMLAGTRAVFIYFNGWKLCGAYGAVWN